MNVKGQKYRQTSLISDLRQSVAGQTKLTKLVLLVLVLFLCFFLGLTSGFYGGGLTFNAIIDTPRNPKFILVGFNIIIWLFGTSAWGWKKASWLVALIAFFLMIALKILTDYQLINLDFLDFALNLIIGFTICSFLFSIIRIIIAQVKISFASPRKIHILLVFMILTSSFMASLSVFSTNIQNLTEPSKASFEAIGDPFFFALMKTITIAGGFGLSTLLIVVAWISNWHRQVPWNYPDIIRDLALVIGSWCGTSFYNLDLSNVNFEGAILANTDLRAQKFFRVCFQNVVGLGRARVNNQYLDLAYPKVQRLLTHGCSVDPDFRKFNLQGAYLQNADMRGFDLTDTNLTGADFKGADLRGSRLIRTQLAGADLEGVDLRTNILIDANLTEANLRGTDLRDCILVRAQVARADFSGADLTGACIEDWSVSSKTTFTDVRCDYVFRQYENGQPTHRYPSDRNFEPGEFAALFQQPENELELIFKGDFSYSALSLAFDKLKTEKPNLDLELQGIEQRGNLWVVLVTSNNPTVEAELEQQFSILYQPTTSSNSVETTIKDSIYRDYEDIKQRLAESQQLVRQFAGISESQAEALKQLSKQALGTNFFIEGSNITNLTGQGQIEYTEAAGQIRSLVTHGGTEAQISQGSQQVLTQLQDIATTPPMQTELIQQILLREAENDPAFRSFLLQQQQQILRALPPGTLASAIQRAIAQLADS